MDCKQFLEKHIKNYDRLNFLKEMDNLNYDDFKIVCLYLVKNSILGKKDNVTKLYTIMANDIADNFKDRLDYIEKFTG